MQDTAKNKTWVDTARDYSQRIVKQENFILIMVLVGLVALMAIITGGTSISGSNLMNVLLQSSIVGVAAVGMTFVILTGGIDLSVGGGAVLAGCVGAWLMSSDYGGLFLGLALFAMILLGSAVGAFNGFSVSRIGLPAFIVTLAVWQATKGAAYQVTQGLTIWNMPPELAFIGQGKVLGIPMPIIIFAVFAIIGYFVLHHTTFGRSIYAVGGDVKSAWLSGIKTKRVLFTVYIISGFCAAVAGMIVISRVMSASVAVVNNLEINAIAAVVIGGISLFGGRGTIIGAVIGALILGVVNNGMNLMNLNPSMQDIVKGVVIFAAVGIDAFRRR